MNDALGVPATVVLLGGTSDIGRAICGQLVAAGAQTLVLAGRDGAALDAAAERFGSTAKTHVVAYDARDDGRHTAVVDEIVGRVGDLDLVICAVGVLGDQQRMAADPQAAAQVMHASYVGPAATLLAVAERMRRQGHGRIVVLSSVAGERVRAANFIYGSAKAGLDGFALGLGDALVGTGVEVLVVRPGFVRSRMTAHLDDAPFATTPEQVAVATVRALERGDDVVWVPGIVRWVMAALRHLPRSLFRCLAA
ncbi:MAG: decaprenylphospho-beta-D-erythro-pentofuranosid-2-ulose 2-reductase [Actinobacteria bacterium]|nr:decaprenylphospho-beta-D-erythro-pentofuranosid-2-ulose 2-reductase [Actinomycetota bacterium]